MRRCLVVANQTVGAEALTRSIKERIAAGECSFYVVVPATRARDLFGDYGALMAGLPADPSPDERDRALAEQRLDTALSIIRDAGGTAEGEVGPADPLVAARQALAEHPADEIIVATLPRAVSRWLRHDLPTRLEQTCGLPVTHVPTEARHPARTGRRGDGVPPR